MLDDPPRHRFADWEATCPGVLAGITAVPEGDRAGSSSDFGLSTGGSTVAVMHRYERLAAATGMTWTVVARQVHGTLVRDVGPPPGERVCVVGEADGLVTATPGLLLAVTAADCVPVFVADIKSRCVALLHAGWKGAAAGVLGCGIEKIRQGYGVAAQDLAVFLGPAICGSCYEVGSEVLRAFGKGGDGPALLDLRSELAVGAVAAGVPADRVSRSAWCTRCGPERFHSHRASGAAAGRMAAFLGLEAGADPRRAAAGRELR